MRPELTWPHKDRRVVFDPATGRPAWAEPGPPPPCPLLTVSTHGDEAGRPWSPASNLLIQGDNLPVLYALERFYAGQVRLVYIDPPYNTGTAFDHYDDGLEHSLWLSMMRERLLVLRRLLRDDGAIFVEIDDGQLGYLRVLMDEVFGRSNYLFTVSVRRSAATGHKAVNPGLVNVTEYIIAYARHKPAWRWHPQVALRGSYDRAYNLYIPNRDEPWPAWRFIPLSAAVAAHLGYPSAAAARRALGRDRFGEESVRFALRHARAVVRFAQPDYRKVGAAVRAAVDRSRAEPDRVHRLERPPRPDMYLYRGNRILFLADKVAAAGEGAGIAEPLTNFWDDIPWQGIAREGGVAFPKGKKPERLLRRILHLATDPGDLVLDSFAGSGTTGAVAHKEGRRWILVELGAQAVTHCLPRLEGVITGRDPDGVARGGGFRFMRLGGPLTAPGAPLPAGRALVEAVLSVEGFWPTGEEPLHGHRHRQLFAHVAGHPVTPAMAAAVAAALPPGARLVIYAPRFEGGITGAITKQIPRDLGAGGWP